jgi:hypothetical protein
MDPTLKHTAWLDTGLAGGTMFCALKRRLAIAEALDA